MATQELTPISWAYTANSSSYDVATVVTRANNSSWYTNNSKRAFNFVNEKGFFLPIYDISNLDAKYINLELIGENASRDIVYECYVYAIRGVSFSHSSPLISLSARELIYQSSNSTGRFSYAINNFNSTPISGSDENELLQEEPYSYIGVLGVFASGDARSVDVSSFSASDSQGSSDPTPKTVQVTVSPSSPSGNSNDSSKMLDFTWRISCPQGVVYKGTEIQVFYDTDTNYNSPKESWYVSGRGESKSDTRTFSSAFGWMWRARADIDLSSSPTDGSILDTTNPTPWSDFQTFKTKDPEQGTINSVNLSSPENNKTFYFGNTISLSWSISKTSNIDVSYVQLYIDNSKFGDKLSGAATSKTLTAEDLISIGSGSHEWYVIVYPSASGSSGGVSITPLDGGGYKSNTRTFNIDYNTGGITIDLTSPSIEDDIVKGKEITFQWSIRKDGSNINIESTDLYIDGDLITTVYGSTTSYKITKKNIEEHPAAFTTQTHSWRVDVKYTAPQGTNVSVSYTNTSRQFKIREPVAKATPSSPGSYNSSDSVPGNAPVTFKWSISQDSAVTEEYSGSELQWRYSTENDWKLLGSVEYSINEFRYELGFIPHTIVHWRVKTGLGGRAASYPEVEYATFEVGDEDVKSVKISLEEPKGDANGAEPITFIWTAVPDDGAIITGTQLEYSKDKKITWTNPETSNGGVITGNYETYVKTYPIPDLPADTIYWRVRAKTNGDYGDWVESSFTVYYGAVGKVVADPSVCPITQGFRHDFSSKFDANLIIDGVTTENIIFKDAQFCWKMANGSDYATEEMAVNDKYASISFKGYKFPTGVLYWYITATDSKDHESQTILYTSYVLESSIDSFAIKPKLSYIDMGQKIPFEWGFIAANGHLSIATEICFSKDGKEYGEPVNINDPNLQNGVIETNAEGLALSDLYTGTGNCFFEANYFSPGIVHWKVRSRSSDSVIGEWSEPASFIVTGTSQPLDFTCDEKPFATLKWTTNGQIAYQIRVDNAYGYGAFHGEAQEFTFPEPLMDGTHILDVRSQNQLGQWGPWSSILVFIQNQPSISASLKLSIDANVDAALQWNPVILNADDEFLVYRDNKLIARLPSGTSSYLDRLALGKHKYRVVQKLPDGNYNLYTRSAVNMSTEVTKISLLRGGSWIDLLLTSEQYPQNTYSHSRIVEKSKIMGAKHQVIEISDFEENTGEYKFCWPYYLREQSKLFDSLVGQAVIIKSRGEQVICGVLESCSMTVSSQIVECDFSLEQMSTDADLSIAVRPEDTLDMMTNLDIIYFGKMNSAELAAAATNPGYTNPRWYEEIAEAINEKLAESERLTRKTSDMSSGI